MAQQRGTEVVPHHRILSRKRKRQHGVRKQQSDEDGFDHTSSRGLDVAAVHFASQSEVTTTVKACRETKSGCLYR